MLVEDGDHHYSVDEKNKSLPRHWFAVIFW